MVVGGTRGDNSSTNTVEMLPLDDPVNSRCKSPASLPNNIDRAVGVNFFPFWDVKARCECIVPPYYHGKDPKKYPKYFTDPKYVAKQPKDKCCCKGEFGIPYEKRTNGVTGHEWQAKKGVKWCRGALRGPLVCGGRINEGSPSRTCFLYSKAENKWNPRTSRSGVVPTLNQPRELSAGMMHVPLGFVVTGGIEDISTGEVTQDGARMSTNIRLPIGIDRHCLAGNNAHWLMQRGYQTGKTDFLFAMGGYSNELAGGYSNRAYIMRCDVGALGSSGCGSLVWIRVSNMNVAREGVMCGVVQDRNEYKVVVAGGLNKDGYRDEVEIYDMNNDRWDMGNRLPFGPRAFAASVPTPDVSVTMTEQIRNPNSIGGMTFYIVGGEGPVTDEVWKYIPSGDSWSKMGARLSEPRTAVTAMIVYQNQFQGC